VNVSDRDQMVTMATPVSRYKNNIQPMSRASATDACRQAGVNRPPVGVRSSQAAEFMGFLVQVEGF